MREPAPGGPALADWWDLCDTMLHMVIPALAVVGWLVDRRVPVASLR
jgi:hypothetical protein